ncbi:hypothetical protein KF840_07150 [bacterium]|nr:hypothetical protein [bacterium]
MPLLHVYGRTLVAQDELDAVIRQKQKPFQTFARALHAKENAGRFDFSSGAVAVTDVLDLRAEDNTPIKPVAIGSPATVLLRHVYTGRLPHGTIFSKRKDLLLTSAVRDVITTFNSAPRAVNLLKQRVGQHTNIVGPDATEDGALLVYYSPALTMQSTTVTFDVAFDDFPQELVDKIGSAISSAGSIPVFGPYSGVLIAVGAAIKLLAPLADALVDAKPDFSVTERLEFEIPGSPLPTAGFKVLTSPTFDHTAFEFELGKGLIHKDTHSVYEGDEPYIVFLLDGTKNDAFEKFTPTAASAALLSRFLTQKEGSELLLNTIVDATKLYNDFKFRSEADRLEEKIKQTPEGPELEELKKKRKAMIDNILTDLLKPRP